jgi:heme-degrading monooxygenase HmoA
MIGVFVTFAGPDGPDRDRAAKVAHEARGMFEGMPGLRSKAFTYDEAAGRAINAYVWESEEAARSFFSDDLVARVTGLYGVPPTVDYVEILELVDNSTA